MIDSGETEHLLGVPSILSSSRDMANALYDLLKRFKTTEK